MLHHSDTTQQKPPVSPFASSWQALVDHGYHPLPLVPKDKAPGERASSRWRLMSGWNKFRDTKPELFILKLWATYPDGGVGCVMGTPAGAGWELACVDIDTEDDIIMEQIESVLPP